MSETCNNIRECNCECPEGVSCPLDNALPLEKDRGTARKKIKKQSIARQNSQKKALVLAKKLSDLPEDTPLKVITPLQKKAQTCAHKAQRGK